MASQDAFHTLFQQLQRQLGETLRHVQQQTAAQMQQDEMQRQQQARAQAQIAQAEFQRQHAAASALHQRQQAQLSQVQQHQLQLQLQHQLQTQAQHRQQQQQQQYQYQSQATSNGGCSAGGHYYWQPWYQTTYGSPAFVPQQTSYYVTSPTQYAQTQQAYGDAGGPGRTAHMQTHMYQSQQSLRPQNVHCEPKAPYAQGHQIGAAVLKGNAAPVQSLHHLDHDNISSDQCNAIPSFKQLCGGQQFCEGPRACHVSHLGQQQLGLPPTSSASVVDTALPTCKQDSTTPANPLSFQAALAAGRAQNAKDQAARVVGPETISRPSNLSRPILPARPRPEPGASCQQLDAKSANYGPSSKPEGVQPYRPRGPLAKDHPLQQITAQERNRRIVEWLRTRDVTSRRRNRSRSPSSPCPPPKRVKKERSSSPGGICSVAMPSVVNKRELSSPSLVSQGSLA